MQLSTTLPAQVRRLSRAVVDAVLPPRCLACGVTVGEPDALCAMLGGDDVFRAALVRGVRVCLALITDV